MRNQWVICQNRYGSRQNQPLLWAEHGEGDPYCQIRVAAETFMNSQFGHERDRLFTRIQPQEVFFHDSNLETAIQKQTVYFRCMADKTAVSETGSRDVVANYVASMSAALAMMARRSGLDTLGYLLEMVRLEAEGVTRQSQNGGR